MFIPSLIIVASILCGPQISDVDVQDNTSCVVVYNIQDLEFKYQNYLNVPEIDLNNVLQHQANPFKDNIQHIDRNDKNPQEIVDLIKSTIEPETWFDGSSITYWNGNLIINAPKRVHDQIQ